MKTLNKLVCLIVTMLFAISITGCVEDTKPVPKVMGMKLSEAKRKLSAVGFKNITVKSNNGKAVVKEADWDVSRQDPAGS